MAESQRETFVRGPCLLSGGLKSGISSDVLYDLCHCCSSSLCSSYGATSYSPLFPSRSFSKTISSLFSFLTPGSGVLEALVRLVG